MSATDEGGNSLPARTIHAAYQQALDARHQYQKAAGTPFESDAHEALHDAVAAYYEVLRPLVSSSNATEQLWEQEELWPTQPIIIDVAACPACGATEPLENIDGDDVQINELCPNCGNAVVEKDRRPKTDEQGQVEYHHVEGLKSVDDAWNQQVEREVEYTDALGTHTETRVETQLLPPEHLQAIARALDEALDKLDLHAEVNDEVPTTELDREDIDRFQEQLQSIREEWGDEDGLEDSEVTDS